MQRERLRLRSEAQPFQLPRGSPSANQGYSERWVQMTSRGSSL